MPHFHAPIQRFLTGGMNDPALTGGAGNSLVVMVNPGIKIITGIWWPICNAMLDPALR